MIDIIEFDNTYGLTRKEHKAIDKLNAEREWMLTCDEVVELAKQFKAAHLNGDNKTMGKIVYRLVDCNFHTEANILCACEYDRLIKAGGRRVRAVSE